ncbi:unnamed protein product [Psylliodes chrysocephalus]|uniref:Membrane protein BRI3 n=1 Tax=Psylliodes chrysocephalus TaxID=3402493 RepID=A0A9P0G8Y0_9CUCU|nr:unnamed protein product [Psylliodes chrysocephala]
MEKQHPPPYEMGHTNPEYSPQAPPQNYMGGPNSQYAPPPQHMGGQSPYSMAPPQPQIVYMQPPAAAQATASSVSTNVTVNTGGGGLGGCPVCHNNSWTGTYDCCAWLWLICCFPCGIICCCCMRKKKCTQCGYTVG